MITPRLLELARAMASFEGGYPFRAWKNHNPGNLRASPFALRAENGFAVFVSDEVGHFAHVWDLWSKCRGNTSTGLTGNSTLRQLIAVYSPDGDTIIDNYTHFVAVRCGVTPDTRLSHFISL